MADRPTQESELTERLKAASNVIRKHLERTDDFALSELPWSEQYADGKLTVLAELCGAADPDADSTNKRDAFKGNAAAPRAIERNFLRMKRRRDWNDGGVFVLNVELVQFVKAELSAGDGLKFSENKFNGIHAGVSARWLSSDGTFYRLSVPAKWKHRSPAWSAAVCGCEDCIRVVESDSEIVNCVTQDRGDVSGEHSIQGHISAVLLGPKTLVFSRSKFIEYGFEVGDVMIGPFQF